MSGYCKKPQRCTVKVRCNKTFLAFLVLLLLIIVLVTLKQKPTFILIYYNVSENAKQLREIDETLDQNLTVSQVRDLTVSGQIETDVLVSRILHRSILVKSTIKNDDRFRVEILKYYELDMLPKSCAVGNDSLPKPVQSQEVYNKCSEPRVPNIVHLVWLYGKPYDFTFRQLLSGLSILLFIKPCSILFWYDGSTPTGKYWKHFLVNITARNIDMEMLNITVPNTIWGKHIRYIAHSTDIIRFEVLKHFGGMYLDLDVIVLKSVTPLRCYDYTLGRQHSFGLPASFVFSVPWSPFLLKIIENYKNYSSKLAYNSVRYPHNLFLQHPELIHVEEDTINRPNFYPEEKDAIFDASCTIDWRRNYAIHLWNRKSTRNPKDESPESIINMQSTFGQVARYIYYGEAGKCTK